MYGLAYAIGPTEFASLQAALDESLAPFRPGGTGDFLRERLAFDDVTNISRRLQAEATALKIGKDVGEVKLVGRNGWGGEPKRQLSISSALEENT